MYREYRDMPVVNRTCMKATQDRAYQKHLEALQKTKATINTSAPQVPRTVGLNMKKYENEKQRNEEIAKDNLKLYKDIEKIQNRKKSPHQSPQSHFTLRGQYQVEQAEQIDRENRKLVNALVNQKPNIKRTDFYYHNCDHLYQVNKMSVHKKTVPMSQIMRQKLPPMENPSEPKSTRQRAPRKIPQLDSNKAPSSSRDNLFVTNKDSINQEGYQYHMKGKSDEINDGDSGLLLGKVYDDDEEEEEWNDEFIESTEPTDSKGKLDQILDENGNILAGSKDESNGELDQITDDNIGMLVGNKKEDQDNSDDDDIDNDDDNQEIDQSDQDDDINKEDSDPDTNQSDQDDDIDNDDDQDDNSNDTDEDSSNKQEDQSESKGELDEMANNQFNALMGNKNDKLDDKKGKLDNLASNNFNNLMGINNKSDDDNEQELEDDDQDDDQDDDLDDDQDDDLDDDQDDDLDDDED